MRGLQTWLRVQGMLFRARSAMESQFLTEHLQ